MKTSTRQIMFIVIAALTYGVYKILNSGIMLPIGTFIISTVFIYKYFILRSLIKTEQAVKLKKPGVYHVLFNFVFALLGVFWLIEGLSSSQGSMSYFGIDSISYIGFLQVIVGLTVYHDYEIILYQDHLIYKRYGNDKELKYDLVDKVAISEKELIFHTGEDTVEFDFTNKLERGEVSDFLLKKFGGKMVNQD